MRGAMRSIPSFGVRDDDPLAPFVGKHPACRPDAVPAGPCCASPLPPALPRGGARFGSGGDPRFPRILRMTALLKVEDLHVAFRLHDERGRSRHVEAVGRGAQGVSFEVPANTTVAIVGESGSGKSVTAMALVQLLPRNAE